MISFAIENIGTSFLKVRLSLRVIKMISLTDTNQKLQFYFKVGNDYELLDSTFFYTQSLPLAPRYTDRLIANNEIINFDYSNPALATGITGEIVALNEISSTIVWRSASILLKTKPIRSPGLITENRYAHDRFVSTLNFSYLLDEEDRILGKFYIKQEIMSEGLTKSIVGTTSNIIYITERVISIEYQQLSKYASYYIRTQIFNHDNKVIYTDISHYVNIPKPLPIAYRQAWDPNPDATQEVAGATNPINYRVKGIRNAFYRSGNTSLRIVDYKIKL